jgi:hypothetical protein
VAATIINGGGEDPRVDGSGKISNLLLRQQRAYKKLDPATQHQKALPPEVYPSSHEPTHREAEQEQNFCAAPSFSRAEAVSTQAHKDRRNNGPDQLELVTSHSDKAIG